MSRLIDADALIEFCAERWIPLNIDAVNMQPTIQPEKAQLSQEGATFDLISRQAAIDALVQCTNCGDEDTLREYVLKHSLDNGWTGGILEALDAVKDLPPTQPEPKWIPVSERLPEKGGEYLVSVRWYREDDIDINVYDYDARCKEWNDGESCGQRVIAWMPLPEAYKPNK